MKERAVVFGSRRSLVGVLSDPEPSGPGGLPAVVLLNAGLLHHVGPNRLYVKLARRLCAAGYTVLRFDFSGIGDSAARDDGLPLEDYVIPEVREAMDHLAQSRGAGRFVLGGLCMGADVAFQAALDDHRVVGVVMVNGTRFRRGVDEAPEEADAAVAHASARTQLRYYWSRLASPSTWARVLSGRADLGPVKKTLQTLAKGRRRRGGAGAGTDCHGLLERGAELLVVYSMGSTAWDLFRLGPQREVTRLARDDDRLQLVIVPDVDHVFTLLWSQELLTSSVLEWARRLQ